MTNSTPSQSRRRFLRNAVLAVSGAVAAPHLVAATAVNAGTVTAAPTASSAAQVLANGGGVLALVRPVTTAQLALMPHLDDTHRTVGDAVEVVLWDGDLEKLQAVGLEHELVAPRQAVEGRAAGLLPQPGETEDGEYRLGSDVYAAHMLELFEAHKDSGRVELLEMPTSSLLGRTVYALEIATDVAKKDGRPVVIHDGMHHCREWPAGEMPIMWAYDLLESYDSDATIQSIVDNVRTIILPLVNPDGFDRTVEAAAITGQTRTNSLIASGYPLAVVGKGDQWRKNVRALSNEGPLAPTTGPAIGDSPVGASQPDAYGIDLNRNYPFAWGDESGSSSIPETQTYRGTAPFSEPETHNVRDLVRAWLPIVHITHHTFNRQILIPWGREPREIRSPDWPLMAKLAVEMRDGFTGPNGEQYTGNNYEAIQAFNLYPTSGTSRDWGHACTRTIIFTLEHGDEFHGPYESTIPEMYELNRGAFIRHALAAMDPEYVAKIRGTGPAGGTVEITKTFDTPTELQLAGVPFINSPVAPPRVDDPNPAELRPNSVTETLLRTVQLDAEGDDAGAFDIHVPPSTRAYLINESLVGNEPGTLEPYTVTIKDADGAVVQTVEVTVERGFVAEIADGDTEVRAAPEEIDTDPTPGTWPIPGNP